MVFFKEDIDYYYQPNLMLEYCLMNADLPIALERLKDYRFSLQRKIQDQNRKINSQGKKIQDQNKKIHNLENELKRIKESKAFLMGETLAWPVRKIRNLLK